MVIQTPRIHAEVPSAVLVDDLKGVGIGVVVGKKDFSDVVEGDESGGGDVGAGGDGIGGLRLDGDDVGVRRPEGSHHFHPNPCIRRDGDFGLGGGVQRDAAEGRGLVIDGAGDDLELVRGSALFDG